jgi:hypothetical protein
MKDEKKTGYAEDFPSSANEPVFEALPDYRLATDETPLFETGENKLSTAKPEERLFDETTLDEKTLTELEAFIARARAKKGRTAPPDGFRPVSPKPTLQKPTRPASPPPVKPREALRPKRKTSPVEVYKPSDIPFEVDFGDGRVEDVTTPPAITSEAPPATARPPVPTAKGKPSFEFAFTPAEENERVAPEPEPTITTAPPTGELQQQRQATLTTSPSANTEPGTKEVKRKTKDCPDCQTELPAAARFCFSCGYPQPEAEQTPAAGAQAPEEDFLVLEELPDLEVSKEAPEQRNTSTPKEEPPSLSQSPASSPAPTGGVKADPVKTSGAISTRKYTMAELKQAFREHFQERIIAYFGEEKLKKYYAALEESNSFQQLRDGSLTNLVNWINGGERTYAGVARRINDTMADLTEYFIVEIAGHLSGGVLPQRLLRHQSVDWATVDLFKLVMDFLDFESEAERVYTDFVAMPARALRNATKAFLRAGKDERIFFICDQSLISQAKNGFAVTDAGIYWKNVLQPAGSALYTTMDNVSINQGYLDVDGQFFNAGARLNLKMAVLLDKLRRME